MFLKSSLRTMKSLTDFSEKLGMYPFLVLKPLGMALKKLSIM